MAKSEEKNNGLEEEEVEGRRRRQTNLTLFRRRAKQGEPSSVPHVSLIRNSFLSLSATTQSAMMHSRVLSSSAGSPATTRGGCFVKVCFPFFADQSLGLLELLASTTKTPTKRKIFFPSPPPRLLRPLTPPSSPSSAHHHHHHHQQQIKLETRSSRRCLFDL